MYIQFFCLIIATHGNFPHFLFAAIPKVAKRINRKERRKDRSTREGGDGLGANTLPKTVNVEPIVEGKSVVLNANG